MRAGTIQNRSTWPTTLALVTMALMALSAITELRAAEDASSVALTGVVSSQKEGAMEGVMVSAKKSGATVTVTVATDAQGRYRFPRARLEPGSYAVSIRAIGYELEKRTSVDVSGQQVATLDLKLVETRDLAYQMSNGEWLMSMAGTREQKNELLGCTQCHTLDPIVNSRFTAEEWPRIFNRMSRYGQGSTRLRPQLRPNTQQGANITGDEMLGREGENPVRASAAKRVAEFAASINLSESSRWSYDLKTLPRPKGKAAKVIITEYDLPRPETLPHDAVADARGMIWYADFGSHYLGMLDPKTGKVIEYKMPETKPGAPVGSLDLQMDKRGNIWLGTMFQGALAMFDREKKEFQTWTAPKFRERDQTRIAMVMPVNHDVDDVVWIGGDNEYRVDLKTGEWKAIDYEAGQPKDKPVVKGLSSYGVVSDSKNNFYGLNLNGTYIIKMDARTGEITPLPTPTPDSGPRRGHVDSEDRLWFAEFRGNKIGMLDTKTLTFKEYDVPTPWTNVYDATIDKAGYAWAGGMNNDRVVRVNTRTGETVEYLLPHTTNIRRVNVDNTTNPPTFWVGNNLVGTIIKVEPLD
jgi:streptogramin lyase